MSNGVAVTVTYVNDEGDEVEYTQTVTPEGLAAVLTAMDVHTSDGE